MNKPCSVGFVLYICTKLVVFPLFQTGTGFIRSAGVAGAGVLEGVFRVGRLEDSSLLLGRFRRLSLDLDLLEEEEEVSLEVLPSFLVCFRLLRDEESL